MISNVCDFLKDNEISFSNENLSKKSHIRIGVVAPTVYPKTQEELIHIISLFEDFGISYKILGRMSNVLICTNESNTVYVKTDRLERVGIHSGLIYAECGVRFSSLIRKTLWYGFSLLPELVGIPGSVGGMIYSNAGAFGREIADGVISCKLFDKSHREVVTVLRENMGFGYRDSILLQKEFVLLSATFFALSDKRAHIEERIEQINTRRKNTQPIGALSLGSVFKRPEGDFAARLIDAAGLKGLRIGDAQISEKHAGFIVNLNSATAEDVLSLIDAARVAVYKKFGVMLEEEIEILR